MAHLSSRAEAELAIGPSYFDRAMEAWSDPYHSKQNPDGYISLSVAENKISADLVADRLASLPPLPASNLGYTFPKGSVEVRKVAAAFLERNLTKTPIDPAHVGVVNGGGSVVNLFGTFFADPGEYFILCGPGYKGLEGQLATHARVKIEIAYLDEDGNGQGVFPPKFSIDALQRALDRAEAKGKVRAVLICSPHNPTGEVLSREAVLDIVAWCRKNRLHAIFDELYGLSVFNENEDHVSVASALDGKLGDDVHIIWSLSKDLCFSGGRFGVMYSQNEKLHQASNGIYTVLLSTSRYLEWAAIHILADNEWLDQFFVENKRRLRQAYSETVSALSEMKIPYTPASSGFFLLIDLRKYLSEQTVTSENILWNKICDFKLVLSPGSECFSSQPGFFRVCYAAVDSETLQTAFLKLRDCLESMQTS